MSLPDERAKVWYVRQQRISRGAVDLASKAWALLDRTDLTTSWNNGLGAYIEQVLTTAQVTAAAGASAYTSAVVTDAGLTANPDGVVSPGGFGRQTAEGGLIADLLYRPIIDVKQAIGLGADTEAAMLAGLATLLTYVDTEVADASRGAVQASVTAEPTTIGYVRYLVAPSCSRCIVLAGRLYTHSTGFARHPRCDCQMRPMTGVEWHEHQTDVSSSPSKALAAMTRQQLAHAGISATDQKALADGADPIKVINAKRAGATYTAGDRQFTHEAAKRGFRPTVAQVYRDAGDDRAQAVTLLKRFGYLH